MRSAFIARNEEVEAKSRSSQKDIQGDKGKQGSRFKRPSRSGIRGSGEEREILRRKSPTAAGALRGSGKAGRIYAAGTVSGNVAVLSSHAPFDSRLFSRQ